MPDPSVSPGRSDLGGGHVLPILLYPDPVLQTRCEPAGLLTNAEARQLVRDLLATMYAAGGRALSAPQVGVLRRVFVMDAGWKDGTPAPLVLLDPEILARSDEGAVESESCLSIPGTSVATHRAASVQIGGYDLDGLWHRHLLIGDEARIGQHGTDHLDGRLIGDPPA